LAARIGSTAAEKDMSEKSSISKKPMRRAGLASTSPEDMFMSLSEKNHLPANTR